MILNMNIVIEYCTIVLVCIVLIILFLDINILILQVYQTLNTYSNIYYPTP